MENEFKIECEECDNVTVILTETQDTPEFCSICGRRAEAEAISET